MAYNNGYEELLVGGDGSGPVHERLHAVVGQEHLRVQSQHPLEVRHYQLAKVDLVQGPVQLRHLLAVQLYELQPQLLVAQDRPLRNHGRLLQLQVSQLPFELRDCQ